MFSSNRDGGEWGLFVKRADGTGEATPLVTRDGVVGLTAFTWSADGKTLVFAENAPDTGWDLWTLSVNEATTDVLIKTEANETGASISPNGRWIAYTSNHSGQREVYVDRFPALGDRQRVPADNGCSPHWSADGRELIAATDTFAQLTAVGFDPSSGAVSQEPQVVVDAPYYIGCHVGIDLSGHRFLRARTAGASSETDARNDIHLVQNWFNELQRLVPTP